MKVDFEELMRTGRLAGIGPGSPAEEVRRRLTDLAGRYGARFAPADALLRAGS